MEEWKFEKYSEDETRSDSSSDKFFKNSLPADSLIREFIQNSLDAKKENSRYVKVTIATKELGQKTCDPYLSSLKKHLSACKIPTEDREKTRFVILEDFNTKGLAGDHQKSFFKADNITGKTTGGGSHGIGKAVFPSCSDIKAFFGYSIFEDGKSLQGRAVLQTHKIDSCEYRPYGSLKLDIEKHKEFIKKLFSRKTRQGLSVAIPECSNDITTDSLKQGCLTQFYIPIIKEKLTVEINNGSNRAIDKDSILELSEDRSIGDKINLALEFETAPPSQIKEYTIKKDKWKKMKFPPLNEKDLKEAQNQPLLLRFKVEMPVKEGQDKEEGWIDLIIKKSGTESDTQTIDCWRDSLLISKALGHRGRNKGYSAILIIENNPLSRLFRKLEDPGHTKWETGKIDDEVKKRYKNIPKLVEFVKKLPSDMISQLKYQTIERDSRFFANYFPDISTDNKKETKEGKSKSTGGLSEFDLEPYSPDFNLTRHKNNDGFSLKLKHGIENAQPEKVTVTVAYGTNKGNPFKNYDKRDFKFKKDISIEMNEGEELFLEENYAKYKIKNKKFSLSFKGFDPNKELKIDIEPDP